MGAPTYDELRVAQDAVTPASDENDMAQHDASCTARWMADWCVEHPGEAPDKVMRQMYEDARSRAEATSVAYSAALKHSLDTYAAWKAAGELVVTSGRG